MARRWSRGQHDEILTLLSTGYETIGDALTWTLYLLAKHPGVEARVLAEMRDGEATELPYTRMVMEEAIRLYPPTWIFVRMALGPDQLPDGTAVAAGTEDLPFPVCDAAAGEIFSGTGTV